MDSPSRDIVFNILKPWEMKMVLIYCLVGTVKLGEIDGS